MSERKMVRLGDIFDLQMGKTPDRNRPEYFNTNTNKWVSIADISKAQKYILETKECISDEAVKNSGIKQIPANTIIMSFKLSIGKTAITTEPMYSNEAIMAFLPNGKYEVDNDFFYHLFSNKNWSEGSNKAVKGVTLNKATLTEVKIPLPPLDEQKQIAAVLDKCADIIAKRKQQLSALDDLIKARFVEMFGDPVKNPKGWDYENMKSVCTKITDGEHGSVAKVEHGHPFLNAKHIKSSGEIDWNAVTYTSDEIHKRIYKRCNPEGNDVLITTTGTIGNVAIVPINSKPFTMDRGITLLKLDRTKINPHYIAWLLRQESIQQIMNANVHASAIGHLFLNKVEQIPVMLPNVSLQKEFSDFVAQTDKSKLAIQKSLEKTQLLFDSLMQEYFG